MHAFTINHAHADFYNWVILLNLVHTGYFSVFSYFSPFNC